MLHVHYNIIFEELPQKFNNDNILVEQGCVSIKEQTFHSRNMLILTKFLYFVMFGTRDLRHMVKNNNKKKSP
jgi:hypothetical protein